MACPSGGPGLLASRSLARYELRIRVVVFVLGEGKGWFRIFGFEYGRMDHDEMFGEG